LPASPAAPGATETGAASWYGEPYHGRRAASGEVYDMEQLTAAHRTLPFQTWVEVTNLTNGRLVEVRITDRGPFVEGRIIDVSLAAARELDMVRAGVVPVSLRVIEPPGPRQEARDAVAAEPLPFEEAPPPETSPAAAPAPAGPRYAVQAGAFADRARAESFRDSLPFPDTRVVPRDGDTLLWRVLIGEGLDMDAAAALAREVQRSTGDAFVIEER
jgi:rare lipoprotein A